MVLGLTQAGFGASSLSSSPTVAPSAMKFKLFNLLAVCLATSGLLAYATGAFATSVEPQIDAEQVQHLSCVKQGERLLCEVESSDRASAPNQAAESLKSSTVTINLQMLTPQEQESLANILLWLTYLIPGSACVGILLYDKYCLHRAATLNQKIQILEKLWKQTTQN